MAMEISGGTQRLNTHTYDDQWGILLQEPNHTNQAEARDTDQDIYVGVPIVLGGVHVYLGAGGAGTSTVTWTVPTGFKIRVLDAAFTLRSQATGGTPQEDISITDGTNTIVTSIDLGDTVDQIKRAVDIDDAYHEVAAGGTIKSLMVEGGTTTGNTNRVDVHVMCVLIRV